jgi:hypothetical protein
MTDFTLAHAAEKPPAREHQRERCHAVPAEGQSDQAAERAFEAGVQWFLAVSRTA